MLLSILLSNAFKLTAKSTMPSRLFKTKSVLTILISQKTLLTDLAGTFMDTLSVVVTRYKSYHCTNVRISLTSAEKKLLFVILKDMFTLMYGIRCAGKLNIENFKTMKMWKRFRQKQFGLVVSDLPQEPTTKENNVNTCNHC